MIADTFVVVDADTHVIEPADLWTARAPRRLRDAVPRVAWDPQAEEEIWLLGDERLHPAVYHAMAGWPEYPPDHPRTWADIDPATWDAPRRLQRMDDYGIDVQLLYPNVALFSAHSIASSAAVDVRLECLRIYNDWQVEWAGEAPSRLIPMTSLPLWDIKASIAELQRCTELGHRGAIVSQEPAYLGLPALADSHWDPLWASAQELGVPINFHIATGDSSHRDGQVAANGRHANYAAMGTGYFVENARTIAKLICSGICHRFPDLAFVTVESGIGWIPFAIASLDWQWRNSGVPQEHPEYDLLPSEYFARQIYGTFWFEDDTALAAIEQLGPDNFLFETDFPHPTSMSPGPASSAIRPDHYIEQVIGRLPSDQQRKVLGANAVRVYGLAGDDG